MPIDPLAPHSKGELPAEDSGSVESLAVGDWLCGGRTPAAVVDMFVAVSGSELLRMNAAVEVLDLRYERSKFAAEVLGLRYEHTDFAEADIAVLAEQRSSAVAATGKRIHSLPTARTHSAATWGSVVAGRTFVEGVAEGFAEAVGSRRNIAAVKAETDTAGIAAEEAGHIAVVKKVGCSLAVEKIAEER